MLFYIAIGLYMMIVNLLGYEIDFWTSYFTSFVALYGTYVAVDWGKGYVKSKHYRPELDKEE